MFIFDDQSKNEFKMNSFNCGKYLQFDSKNTADIHALSRTISCGNL